VDISTLYGTQGSAMGLIQGTGVTDNSQSVSAVLADGQYQDQATVAQTGQSSLSPAGQTMSQLQQLATSNPSEFKAATQKISDDLAAAAKNETDSKKSSFLEKLSGKFAEASTSGSMSSLQFHQGGKSKHSGFGVLSVGKYGEQHNSGMFDEVGSIISSALANAGSTAAGTSSATSTSSTTGVSGTGAA
jgi:hypothetical protein